MGLPLFSATFQRVARRESGGSFARQNDRSIDYIEATYSTCWSKRCNHCSGQQRCDSGGKEDILNRLELLRERVPSKPIVVLRQEPDLGGSVIDIQSFVVDGESVIPLFSSLACLTASFGGTPRWPPYGIALTYLLKKLRGDEIFLLNPRLPSELRFSAAELRRAFPKIPL